MTSTSTTRAARRSFYALLGSSFFAITGNAFTTLAIPLYVLATTGSAAKTGIIAFANTAPPIASALLGGPLIDRFGRRRSVLTSDMLSMITLALIPILDRQGVLSFPLLMAIVAMGAFFDPPGSSARQAMLPTFATEAGYSPERAQSLFSVSFGLAQIIGPSLAGVSVAAIGASGTIWVNCVTFAVCLILIGGFVQRDSSGVMPSNSSFLEDLHSGWRYVWNDNFLRAMMVISAAFSGVFVPIYTVLYPVFFTEVIKSQRTLGFFLGMEAAGGLIGAVLYGAIGQRFSRRNAMAFCLIAWLPSYWVLVFHPPIVWLLVAGFVAGLLTGPLQPIFNVAFQVRTPDHMRARVFAMAMACTLIAVPIGSLILGPVIQAAGVIPTLVGLATVVTVLCIWCAFLPILRELDHPLEPA